MTPMRASKPSSSAFAGRRIILCSPACLDWQRLVLWIVAACGIRAVKQNNWCWRSSVLLSIACLQVRVLVILIRSQEKKEERRERKRR